MKAQRLLQLDLLGALATAAVTGGLLATGFVDVGIPHWILAIMAAVAISFGLFDAFSLILVADSRKPLAVIAVLNAAYCCLSFAICLLHARHLTPLGITYFAIETLILIPLAYIEWRVAQHK